MNDGGGNSNEQIRSVEVQIRGVEEQITRVEEQIRGVDVQIRRVDEQIDRVAEQINGCLSDEVRKLLQGREERLWGKKAQLRNEETQLQTEKAQLRHKESQLRDEEAQLLQERGGLTWTEWLAQQLPPLLFQFSTQPGLRQAKHEITPASTIKWDIWPDVDQYVAEAVSKSSRLDRISIANEIESRAGSSTQADCCRVYDSLMVAMCSALFGKNYRVLGQVCSSSSSMRHQRTDPNNNVIELASADFGASGVDIMLKYSDRIFLVVEMKKPSFFRQAVDRRPPDLVKAYANKDNEILDDQRSHVLAQSISQLFKYLVRHGIGYGIISSADLSYFVSGQDNSLRISEGISWSDPRFIRALAYFMAKAANDTTPYLWEGGNGDNHSQDHDMEDHEETEDSSSDFGGCDKGKKLKTTPSGKSATRSMTGLSGLKNTPATHLHLEAHPFATGWSGNIVRGTYEGHVVAVKLAMVCSDRAEALINEASTYLKLEKYWGKYVPMLISHGTTADGNVVYIATELIEGYELGIGGLTPEVVIASFEALNAIHASGILHGDIRRDNILVPKGGRRGVRFIDFGFARSTSSAEDCCKELAQLQDIVSKLHFRRSGSVSVTAVVTDKDRILRTEAF